MQFTCVWSQVYHLVLHLMRGQIDRPVFFSLGDGEDSGRDCQLGGEGLAQLGDQHGHVHRVAVLGGVLVEDREEEEIPSTELVLHQMGL